MRFFDVFLVDFGVTFDRPLGPFVLILAPFWLILGPFWFHLGPDLGYFAPSGVSFWLVLGEIQFLRQKFVKKHSCIDPGIKFLANFRMQTIFPRPGGGTIAAGNRDSPPGRAQPAAERVGIGSVLRVPLFAIFFFFSRRIPSWIPPFPSLVGRVLVTLRLTFGCFWVVVFSVCFLDMFFVGVF